MRTTITMNDTVFRALKIRAAESDESVSKIIEDAVKYQVLEDLQDIEIANSRVNEPRYSYDAVADKFKREGLI